MLFEQAFRASNERLLQLKDKHRGQRCVIIGNGPSLNQMDLSFLKDEITFGLNRIYLLFDKWNFTPNYFVSVNPLVIEQSIEAIMALPSTKFLSSCALEHLSDPGDAIFLKSIYHPFFSKDPRMGLYEGYTVTYVAMQLAYYMGFSEVMLIGVDHHFVTQGPANQEVTSGGADPNHFHPEYFGKGFRWHLPDLANSERSYLLAKEAYESDGRRILDATFGGRLQVFPKVDYQELLGVYRSIEQEDAGHLSHVEHFWRKARREHEVGALGDAKSHLSKVLSLAPNHAEARLLLGGVQAQEGAFKEAIASYREALASSPANAQIVERLGLLLVKDGEPEAALETCLEALEWHPDDPDLCQATVSILVAVPNAIAFHYIEAFMADLRYKSANRLCDLLRRAYPDNLKAAELFAKVEERQSEEQYLVSAIVSVYNSERFIRGCLDDLLAQTIADRLEIVLVNSNSPQGEDAIIREYMAKHPNIKYIRTRERETVYTAWNRGVQAATGKYLTNANTDDRHRQDAFERMVKILDVMPDVALVYADVHITEIENETFEHCTPIGQYRWLDWDRQQLLYRGCFMGPQPMWRRSLHEEYGLFDESFVTSGDYEFWLRVSQTNHFFHIPEILGLYLKSPTSVEHANRERQVVENQRILQMYQAAASMGTLIRRHYTEDAAKLLDVHNRQAEALFVQGDVLAAKTIFEQVVEKNPTLREPLNNLGVVHFQLNEFEPAIGCFKRVLQLDPAHMEAIENLGHCYLALGNHQEASHWFGRALDLEPENFEFCNALGRCFKEVGDLSRARESFEKSLRINQEQNEIRDLIMRL